MLVANPNEYYMDDECTYYHEQSLEDPLGERFNQFCEQAVTLRSEEVVEIQVDERGRSKLRICRSHIRKKKRALRLFQH